MVHCGHWSLNKSFKKWNICVHRVSHLLQNSMLTLQQTLEPQHHRTVTSCNLVFQTESCMERSIKSIEKHAKRAHAKCTRLQELQERLTSQVWGCFALFCSITWPTSRTLNTLQTELLEVFSKNTLLAWSFLTFLWCWGCQLCLLRLLRLLLRNSMLPKPSEPEYKSKLANKAIQRCINDQ